MTIKKVILIILLFLFTFTETGCWDKTELTKLAIATAIGIDKLNDNTYQVSVQIVKTASLASGVSESGGATQGENFFVMTTEGNTIFHAIRALLSKIGRKIFYSNIQVIILSEKVAKDGLTDVLDFFERQHEPQLKTYLLISKGSTPREILETPSNAESISAINISQTLENGSYRLTTQVTTVLDFLKDLEGKSKSPMIGFISKIGSSQIKIEGAAVFNKDKMIGILSPFETRCYHIADEKSSLGTITIKNPCDSAKNIEIEIIKSKEKISVQLKNNTPKLIFTTLLEGVVADNQGTDCAFSKEGFDMLQKGFNSKIRTMIKSSLQTTQQKLHSDIYGFGTYIHKHDPSYWNKVKDNWNDVFSDADYQINVNVKIVRTGEIRQRK